MAALPSLSTHQMKEVDRLMVEEIGIGLIQMMENAGRNLAELARRLCNRMIRGRSIVVLCGIGNNGGGGMVAARHLHNWGAQIQVGLIGDPSRLKAVPAHQWSIVQHLGLDRPTPDLKPADLILDALLGYGAQGDPRPPLAEWIDRANSSGVPILSLDSPSGLDTTTGRPGQPCIRAKATMTLALPKTGLLVPSAKPFVGELYLADIGVPPELYASPSLGLDAVSLFTDDSIIRIG